MELSSDQALALDKIRDWYKGAPSVSYCTDPDCNPDGGKLDDEDGGVKEGLPHTHGGAAGYPPFSLAGLAGTGKTLLAARLAGELGIAIAYGTPTNKAAGVLRRKLDTPAGRKVRTYYSMMYFPVATSKCTVSGRTVMEVSCGCAVKRGGDDECECSRRFKPCGMCHGKCRVDSDIQFVLRDTVGGYRDLVLLDESSMVSEARVQEIRSLGVPVLLVGDHGQLSPVKEQMNRWMMNPDFTLTVNHRQADANGIVDAALRMRASGQLSHGSYGDGSTISVSAKENPDVLDVMDPGRMGAGPDSVIIVPVNAMRAKINNRIHSVMCESQDDVEREESRRMAGLTGLPYTGERVISLQNHYGGTPVVLPTPGGEWNAVSEEFVWNGMTGTIRDVNPRGESAENTVILVIELDDMPTAHGGNAHILVKADVRQFGAPYKMRPDQHAKGAQLWDYGYALTAHKAQGSEYARVVVLDANPSERKRWMYTAMTRAKEKLVVIDWR